MLHAALLATVIWHPGFTVPSPPLRATVEVQLVQQTATRKGLASAPAQTAMPSQTPPDAQDAKDAPSPAPLSAELPPAPSPSGPSGPPPPEAPPAEAAKVDEVGAQPPPAPPPATPAPAPAQPSLYADLPMPAPPQQPAVNLAGGEEDREALSVHGDVVMSEGPDARFHNMPPSYPRDAARAHRQGNVSLLIHITQAGLPGLIEIMKPSGTPSMDAAAQEAVARWKFKPAMQDGAAVQSVYLLNFNFIEDKVQ